MTDGGYDVLVTAFAPRHETAAQALARVVGIAVARGEALCRALPCVVLSDVAYARAESIAASLQLAGAEASVMPHAAVETPAVEGPGRLTMPEIGAARSSGLRAGRDAGGRFSAAPTTLRPRDVSEVEPAVVFEPGARATRRAEESAQVSRPGMETLREPSRGPASSDAAGWAKLELERAPPASASQPLAFAADFGRGLDHELELAPVLQPGASEGEQADSSELPERAESERVSLDFRLSFPRVPPAVPAAARVLPRRAPEHGPPATPGLVTAAAPAARAPRPLLEPNGTITRRTVLLLALLWLSVALLLWTHDLL
jgi:hypothetical protein